MDMLKYEQRYWKKGIKNIGGIDEAGRGPLAGPVVASCVILDPLISIEGIKDSKKLSPKKREQLYLQIIKYAKDVSVGIANEDEIDNLNILQATFLAMRRAIGNLNLAPEQLLIDGPYSNIKLIPVDNIIKGDNKSLSIASASIVAKVVRDKLMIEYHNIYPNYGFDKHKGYGTKYHIENLKLYKASPIHRKTFKIVKSFLPTYNYYKKKNILFSLASQIAATEFIKKFYCLEDKDILLDSVGEHIDYAYSKKNKIIYVKVLLQDSNKRILLDKEKFDLYTSFIKKELIKKDSKKKIWINVILIEFKPNNKPKISYLYNEKIS